MFLKFPETCQVPVALEGIGRICPVASGAQGLAGLTGVTETNVI